MKPRFLALTAVVAAMVIVMSAGCRGGSQSRQRLFFTSGNSLYSVAEDGTGLKLVATLNADTPLPVAFSPDGQRVAHPCRPDGAADQSQTALCLSRVGGSDQRIITEDQLDPPGSLTVAGWGGGQVAWSPDSARVAFLVHRVAAPGIVSSGDVYVYDVVSATVRRVDPGAFAELRSPMRWSPDGRRIAVPVVQTVGAAGVIRIIDIGSAQTPATTHNIGPGASLNDYEWAPDGSALAYTGGTDIGVFDVSVVGADDGTPRALMQGKLADKLTWSPDSRTLAVTANDAGATRLFVVPAAGGDARSIAPEQKVQGPPAWSPDSQELAFVAAGPQPDPNRFPDTGLYVVPAAGGAPRRVTPNQKIVVFPLLTWSPDGKRIFYTAEGPPCMEGCPPGPLFVAPADGSAAPVAVTSSDVLVDQLLGWR